MFYSQPVRNSNFNHFLTNKHQNLKLVIFRDKNKGMVKLVHDFSYKKTKPFPKKHGYSEPQTV